MKPSTFHGQDRIWIRTSAVSAVGVVLIGLAGGAGAATGVAQDSQRHYAAARHNLEKGERAAAVIELKNAIRTDPANSDARFELALIYLGDGNPAGALSELESAKSRGYDPKKVVLPLAQTYLALGRFRDVLAKVDPSIVEGEPRAAVLAAQARASMALEDPQNAKRLLDEALKISPNLTSALVASAMLLSAEGKIAEAEALIRKAGSDETQADLLILKGELRQKQGDLEGALAHFNSAAKKYPNYAGARIKRAGVNMARNQLDAVQEDIDWVLAREPRQPLALFLKAYVLAREKKYREANQILLALPDLLDHYPPAVYLLAATALEDGQVDLAFEQAQRYVQSVPNDLSGNKLLALLYQRKNMAAKAVAILEPLTARFPNDNQLKLQFAGALLEVGRSVEAIALFQRGITADPENKQARLALAMGQLQAGKTGDGVAEIEKLVQSDPKSLQANALLVLTQLQTRQPESALRTAKAMVAVNDNDPNAHNLLGTVYLSTNDPVNARTSFQAALQKDAKFVPASLNLAQLEEKAGERAAAKQWYEKVVAIEPGNMIAYQGLANLALRDGKTDEAVGYLKQAIARDGAAPEPRLRLIDILLEKKKSPQALIEARDFVTTAPKSPQALDALGRVQLAAGETGDGLVSFQRLAILSPDNAEVQRRLGRAYMVAGTTSAKGEAEEYAKEARAAFDQALKFAPDDSAALADRLELERRAGGAKAALALAQNYSTARPESTPRLIALGDTQLAADQAPAATVTYRKAWDKSKSSLTTTRLYGSLARSGKAAEGMTLLEGWVKAHPMDYDARFLVSNEYLRIGKTNEAIAETQALSAAFPENPVLLNNLAWLYSKQDSAKAIEFAERAYVLAPQSADVLDTLGWLYASASNLPKGEPLLRKAHEAAPMRGDIGFHYAVVLDKSKKPDAAKAVLEKTLASDTRFAERAEAQSLFEKLSASRAKN